jgi:UDP-N-acetylmuramyl pentapeptide synthase
MPNKEAIIAHLSSILEPDDVVLIKGSNAQRLDKIVSALTAQRDKEVISRAGKA